MAAKKSRVVAAAAGAFLLAGAGIGGYLYQNGNSSGGQGNVMQTVPVARDTVNSTLRLTGSVASQDERALSPRASGTVTRVYVKAGDPVKAGQRLLELNDADAKRQLHIAETQLDSAELRLDDLEDKSASDSEIAEAEVAVHKAEADVAGAQSALKNTVLASPIAGTVLAVGANVGDQVSSGGGGGVSAASASGGTESAQSGGSSGLITVADLGRLEIEAAIDQADISEVAKGQSVKITLDALPDQEFSGVVASIDPVPVSNQNVVTYNAYVAFNKQSPEVRLGMTADLELTLGLKENVLTVPNSAIRSIGGRRVVAKVVGDTRSVVRVETGLSDEERTEIVSGLSEGDRVAVRVFSPTEGTGTNSTGGGFFGGPGFGGPPGLGGTGLGGRGASGRSGGQSSGAGR